MGFLDRGDKGLTKEILLEVKNRDNFFNAFRCYLTFVERLASKKSFASEDLDDWIASLNHLLILAREISIDKNMAGQLTDNIIFCALHSVEKRRHEVFQLIKRLCDVIRFNDYVKAIVQYTHKRVENGNKSIACILYSEIGPGDPVAIAFFKKLWHEEYGQQIIIEYAVPNFKRIIPTAFGVHGYSQYKSLLEWIRDSISDPELRKATQLILGLWQGKYAIVDLQNLDAYYDYFNAINSSFSREMIFPIACMTTRLEKLHELIENYEDLSLAWAAEYKKLVMAFLSSMNSVYPEIGRQSIVRPSSQNFPRPLYAFLVLAFSAYAAKYIRNLDIDELYSEVTGPWKSWVSQFSAKEFPYQIQPDIAKYAQLLVSELTSTQIKEYIAPWIIEIVFHKEGLVAAQKRVQELPSYLHETAQKRLAALQGKMLPEFSSPGPENDILNGIRCAIVQKNLTQLEQLKIDSLKVQIHPNELKLIDISIKCLNNDPLNSQDLNEAKNIAERGLPVAVVLVAKNTFRQQNFSDANTLLQSACSLTVDNKDLKELWAQSLASTSQPDKAADLLSPHVDELSDNAIQLYAWCLFAKSFPTETDLINFALNSKSMLADQTVDDLLTANDLLNNDANGLKGFLEEFKNQIENPYAPPLSNNLPTFAEKWHQVRVILAENDISAVLKALDELKKWATDYAEELAKQIASRFLGKLSPEDDIHQEELQALLDVVGKNKEEFYADQFYKDIELGVAIDMIYKKYQQSFPTTHPVFRLVIIYNLLKQEKYDEVLAMLNGEIQQKSHPGMQLVKIYCQYVLKEIDTVLDGISDFCHANPNNALTPKILLLGIQYAILNKNKSLSKLFNFAKKHNHSTDDIPPVFKSQLLIQSIKSKSNSTPEDEDGFLKNLLNEDEQRFFELTHASLDQFVDLLPKIHAKDEWGDFLFKKVMKLMIDNIKRADSQTVMAEITRVIPSLLTFINQNSIEVESTVVDVLSRLNKIASGISKCDISLQAILRLENAEELVHISDGLLEKLSYPDSLESFLTQAKELIKDPQKQLDNASHIINVILCWLEYLSEQKVIMEQQVYSPLLEFLSQLWGLLLAHENFSIWFIERRKALPEKQQFIDKASAYLELEIYDWLCSHYFSNLNFFYKIGKLNFAKLYADFIEKMGHDLVNIIGVLGLQNLKLNKGNLALIEQKFKDGVVDWIKDRKGNLVNQ
ncbi:MAG: hypothetical protein DWQ10_13785, partial [Calditrichaeota bacterium]